MFKRLYKYNENKRELFVYKGNFDKKSPFVLNHSFCIRRNLNLFTVYAYVSFYSN